MDRPCCAGADPAHGDKQHKESAAPPNAFSPEDEQFLDDLERSNFLFFWEQASPQTGLIKDRCNARTTDTSVVASIASTGFGLTAICIAEKRGFISAPGRSPARDCDAHLSLADAADASRIFLSLCQHQYRGKNLGL